MSRDLLAVVLSGICEAALKPEAWPGVLQDIAGYLEADGAAYILKNKRTARVEWINLWGASSGRQDDYVNHFAALDPYWPLLEAEPGRGWLRLLTCLPEPRLRHDAWYNEFVMKSGIGDILGAQLGSTPTHSVVFGLHYGLHRALPGSRQAARWPRQATKRRLTGTAARGHRNLNLIGGEAPGTRGALYCHCDDYVKQDFENYLAR